MSKRTKMMAAVAAALLVAGGGAADYAHQQAHSEQRCLEDRRQLLDDLAWFYGGDELAALEHWQDPPSCR